MDNDDTMLNNCGPQSGAETVYGTEDNNMVMSEKVSCCQVIHAPPLVIRQSYFYVWMYEYELFFNTDKINRRQEVLELSQLQLCLPFVCLCMTLLYCSLPLACLLCISWLRSRVIDIHKCRKKADQKESKRERERERERIEINKECTASRNLPACLLSYKRFQFIFKCLFPFRHSVSPSLPPPACAIFWQSKQRHWFLHFISFAARL